MAHLLLIVSTWLFAEGLFSPVPAKVTAPSTNPMTQGKVELGKQLFFDPRLSKDGTISCNSCHNVMGSGTDSRPVSLGVRAQAGKRNSPTVWNAALMSVQFWDGRAPSLEEQAKGPLINPIEMGMENHDAVMARIRKIPGYMKDFKLVFGTENPTIDHVAQAIASYERTLITPKNPFDRFLAGDKKALSAKAQEGYKKIQEVGCISCHNGVNFAGPAMPEGMGFFQKFPTYAENEYVQKYDLLSDQGKKEATQKEEDKYLFRVAGWRNVAATAPYLHNGKVATLDELVRVMAKTQLNKDLSSADVESIVAFLESLTGEFPKQAMPRLPDTVGKTVLE